MIVGSGLIANSFINDDFDHSGMVVFASGVSNSTSGDLDEYEKELSLLKSTISSNADKVFLYFSTTSVLTKKDSIYVEFKRNIEAYIKENCSRYLLLRMPNIVGNSGNKSQLLPYFYDSLISGKEISVDLALKRYLIDVDDIPRIVSLLENFVTPKETINVYFDNGITVSELLKYLEELSGLSYKKVKFKQSFENTLKKNTLFQQITQEKLDLFNVDPFNIIKKYYENPSSSVYK